MFYALLCFGHKWLLINNLIEWEANANSTQLCCCIFLNIRNSFFGTLKNCVDCGVVEMDSGWVDYLKQTKQMSTKHPRLQLCNKQ